MAKKITCWILAVISLLSLFAINVGATSDTEEKTIKKVVSIVYDDSMSMDNSNEDWAYASYSLQNLIGLLNPQDELGVVKMSNPTQTVGFDLSTNASRAAGIQTVEGWQAHGGSTPFEAVHTAADWLKAKKSGYADSQSVEFWLVVITDGVFVSGYPDNMPNYLSDLKDAMGNSKYEGVFVAIGNNVPAGVKTDWISVTGNHLITAANSTDIVNAMSEVSGLIIGQGGRNANVNITTTVDEKGILFVSSFPLKKFIVYEQNQNVGITSISVNGGAAKTTADFLAEKPGRGTLTSRTIHCESDGEDYIPAGQIAVYFDSPIDTTTNNFKILMDSAVNVDIKVFDDEGNEIEDLSLASLAEGETVEFTSTVTSSVDKSPISLKNWANELSAQVIVNDQSVEMRYNPVDNTFYGSYTIQSGVNLAYSVVTLPGYFRAKSDLINIYPIEVIDNTSSTISDNTLNVLYKYCEDYEEVGTFAYTVSGGSINGIFNFEFKDMPKGITASVNGIFADDNGKVSARIRNDAPVNIKFYRNKDFKAVRQSTVTIDVTSAQYELHWEEDSITEIIVNPVKREIALEVVKTPDANDLKLNELEGKEVFVVSVLGNGDYLSKEELEELKIDFGELVGIEFETEVVEYNDGYAIQIVCKQTKAMWFVETGDLASKITITTGYGEESKSSELEFHVKDNIVKYLIPALLLFLIVFLFGYLPGVKKRLPHKKYHIQANGEAEAIYVNLATQLFPYVTEKGYGGELSLVASSNKNKVFVINDFYPEQQVLLDGEPIEEGTKKFDLGLGSELKVIEPNRSTVYQYCDSRGDDTFSDDFGGLDDTDNLFGDDNATTSTNNNADDDFFN